MVFLKKEKKPIKISNEVKENDKENINYDSNNSKSSSSSISELNLKTVLKRPIDTIIGESLTKYFQRQILKKDIYNNIRF